MVVSGPELFQLRAPAHSRVPGGGATGWGVAGGAEAAAAKKTWIGWLHEPAGAGPGGGKRDVSRRGRTARENHRDRRGLSAGLAG